ncbi:hypothetical protein PG996_010290 [Apiospora saccharicola]|uniref:Uncharacterized protein n=1 Tax=Apiospora saccharicola TaxID=335842 RepID=A0ABR1UN53_9PEZI
MCTGTIYRMARCGHFIVAHTSKCRRYQIKNFINPPKGPGKHGVIPEPPDEPCPELYSGSNNEPVSIGLIEDSCASCMPRAQQWATIYGNLWMTDEYLSEGDGKVKLDRSTQEQLTTIDWNIIPAPEPVYPPSWTVEDDRGLSAAWVGCLLVWDDQESLREAREGWQLHQEKSEMQRKEEEERQREREKNKNEKLGQEEPCAGRSTGEKEDKPEYHGEKEEDMQTIVKDSNLPRDPGVNNNEAPPSVGSSTIGYLIADNISHGDQDQPSGTDSRSTHSHRHHPQLRKQKGREALGRAEFFSFSNLDEEDDGREDSDSYHIDDQNNDDGDDIWLRIASEQPRDSTTTADGYFPDHSPRNSQWAPDAAHANRSKRFSTQAVRGTGKRYDLKPFILSQHQQR